MIYLKDNPLLRDPLTLDHLKTRLLGHWGSDPGQSFTYIHLNRLIKKYDLDVIFLTRRRPGPTGRPGPAAITIATSRRKLAPASPRRNSADTNRTASATATAWTRTEATCTPSPTRKEAITRVSSRGDCRGRRRAAESAESGGSIRISAIKPDREGRQASRSTFAGHSVRANLVDSTDRTIRYSRYDPQCPPGGQPCMQ